MASYRAFVYCDKCDQPLRKNEYHREVLSSGKGVSVTYYCRICNSLARKPFSMAVWVFVVLLTFLMTSLAAGMLSDLNNTVSDSSNKPLLVFAVVSFPLGYFAYGIWKKSKCKPIYDRWVRKHGSGPENWPDAPRLLAKNRKPAKYVQITVLIIGIVVGVLIWYDIFKAGLF